MTGLALAGFASLTLAGGLRSQLEKLAQDHGIQVEGLEQIGPEPARQAGGSVEEQVRALLADYNFMAVGQGGRLERLRITSPKQVGARPKAYSSVKTERVGSHHQVQATLDGPNGADVGVGLLVDTGATTLVLPASMMAALGFTPGQLQNGSSQTAGGPVSVQTGLLKSVKVGDVVAEDVAVSFVADQKLGGARLLGMSFLNRFRFALDDANNELQLLSK